MCQWAVTELQHVMYQPMALLRGYWAFAAATAALCLSGIRTWSASLSVAWSDASLEFLQDVSCEDPLTGLATQLDRPDPPREFSPQIRVAAFLSELGIDWRREWTNLRDAFGRENRPHHFGCHGLFLENQPFLFANCPKNDPQTCSGGGLYESVVVRRWTHDQQFRLGVQLLRHAPRSRQSKSGSFAREKRKPPGGGAAPRPACWR